MAGQLALRNLLCQKLPTPQRKSLCEARSDDGTHSERTFDCVLRGAKCKYSLIHSHFIVAYVRPCECV